MTGNQLLLIIQVLISMESSGDAGAKNGDAWGCLQITPAYVECVNRNYQTSFTHKDVLDPAKARYIALRYLWLYAGENASATLIFNIHKSGPSGASGKPTAYSREAMRRLNQ